MVSGGSGCADCGACCGADECAYSGLGAGSNCGGACEAEGADADAAGAW